MSFLWIRHGEKKFVNGLGTKGYSNHDPPLKEDCEQKIIIVGYSTFIRMGVPDRIICSPFLRTRQTSEKLQTFFQENYKRRVEIEVDNTICEFLGWMKPRGEKAEVDEKTLEYIEPILGKEKVSDVETRVKEHLDRILKSEDRILIVTHGIVIEFINKYLTGRKLYKVKELEGIEYSGKVVKEFDVLSNIA